MDPAGEARRAGVFQKEQLGGWTLSGAVPSFGAKEICDECFAERLGWGIWAAAVCAD